MSDPPDADTRARFRASVLDDPGLGDLYWASDFFAVSNHSHSARS
jgi:hypothetical protein